MKNKIIYFIGAIILIVDQITKILIDKKQIIINGFFSINPVNNYGAAWSIFSDKTIFLILSSIVILIVLLRYQSYFKMNKKNKIAFGLLYGGLLGNLLDRIMFGYVRDFFDFIIFGYDFPVFNIADASLVIGMFLMIIAILKGEDKLETSRS